MHRRVVITGIGVVSPLGLDRETTWRRLRAGAVAVRPVTLTGPSGDYSALGAPAATTRARPTRELAPAGAAPRGRRRHHGRKRSPLSNNDVLGRPAGWLGEAPDRLWEMTERASREALTDAGLGELVAPSTRSPSSEIGRLRERFGCSIGSSKGNLEFALHALDQLDATDALDARFWTGFVPDALASRVMARHGLMGPSRAPVAACATGLIAVIEAANWIIDERCEVAIAGSADASLIPLVVGSYERMKVLAPFDAADAAGAVRPFSADRQGFVVGEGAALFVLEEREHAARRRARIHAELAGWAMRTSPGASLVALDESPDALVHCIRGALDRAELAPDRVGHVNCHGTATKANDRWETLAIRRAFGAAANRLKLTANKSMIGHLLGAAGSVELAATVLALRDQFVPPTRNLRVPDPECDLDYTPEHGAPAAIDAALKLSFGFGGHVAAVALLADDASATS